MLFAKPILWGLKYVSRSYIYIYIYLYVYLFIYLGGYSYYLLWGMKRMKYLQAMPTFRHSGPHKPCMLGTWDLWKLLAGA